MSRQEDPPALREDCYSGHWWAGFGQLSQPRNCWHFTNWRFSAIYRCSSMLLSGLSRFLVNLVPHQVIQRGHVSSFPGSISSTVSADPILAPFTNSFSSCRGLFCGDVVLVTGTFTFSGLTDWSHSRTSPLAPVFEAGRTSPCDTDRSLDSSRRTTQVVPFLQFVLQSLTMLHSHQIEPFLVDQCSTFLQETHCRSACDAQLHERTSNI